MVLLQWNDGLLYVLAKDRNRKNANHEGDRRSGVMA